MESTPLVSVVTPFYNTQDYLAECIESVLRQTYTNWEYILVNNKSTDRSSEIAEHYASRFPEKIRLYHTEKFLTQVQNYNLDSLSSPPTANIQRWCRPTTGFFPNVSRAWSSSAKLTRKSQLLLRMNSKGITPLSSVCLTRVPEVPGWDIGRLYFEKNIPLFCTPTSISAALRKWLAERNPTFYEERYAPFEDSHVCFDLLRTWNFGFVHQVLTFSRRDNESILSRIRPYLFEPFTRLAKVIAHGRYYLSEEEYPAYLKSAEDEVFFLSEDPHYRGRGLIFGNFTGSVWLRSIIRLIPRSSRSGFLARLARRHRKSKTHA